jgi:hypothetical protein
MGLSAGGGEQDCEEDEASHGESIDPVGGRVKGLTGALAVRASR